MYVISQLAPLSLYIKKNKNIDMPVTLFSNKDTLGKMTGILISTFSKLNINTNIRICITSE
jgi:hypothetical protein